MEAQLRLTYLLTYLLPMCGDIVAQSWLKRIDALGLALVGWHGARMHRRIAWRIGV